MSETHACGTTNDAVDLLSEAECRRLLGTQTLGRVGITNGGLPLIVPVRYVYDDGVIAFRAGAGTKLDAAESGDVLAFEVDTYDSESGRGWSVLVLGRASVVSTAHEAVDLPTLDGSRDDSERHHYVRLFCELVTGRVIELHFRSELPANGGSK